MTEAEWLVSDDPEAMLAYLLPDGELTGRAYVGISERKLRLFACACCRQVWEHLTDERNRNAVEVAELYSDGRATEAAMEKAHYAAADVWNSKGNGWNGPPTLLWQYPKLPAHFSSTWLSYEKQAALLRDIFGNVFRPVTMPYRCRGCGIPCGTPAVGYYCVKCGCDEAFCPWLHWNNAVVVKLAQSAYAERHDDGTLDAGRLAVIADALIEAGADAESELVQHLRDWEFVDDRTWATQPLRGPHVRGCWAIDCILGKS